MKVIADEVSTTAVQKLVAQKLVAQTVMCFLFATLSVLLKQY